MKSKMLIGLVFMFYLNSFSQLRIEMEDNNYFLYEPMYLYIEYQGPNPISTNPENEQINLTFTNIITKEKRIYVPISHSERAYNNTKTNYKFSSIVPIASDPARF